jgi:hypothetical protein
MMHGHALSPGHPPPRSGQVDTEQFFLTAEPQPGREPVHLSESGDP